MHFLSGAFDRESVKTVNYRLILFLDIIAEAQ